MISLKYQIVCIIFKKENNNDIYGLIYIVCSSAKKRCCDPINIIGVLVVFYLNCLLIYIYLMKKSLLL